VGVPYGVAAWSYNYCPAGYTPVTPPGTFPPNITGVGYCVLATTPVAYTQPVTTRVAYVAPRRAVSRVAYAYPRRTLARRMAYRTRAYGYRRVGLRSRATVGYRQVGFRTGPTLQAQRANFPAGLATYWSVPQFLPLAELGPVGAPRFSGVPRGTIAKLVR
jgi:hypothetical protein